MSERKTHIRNLIVFIFSAISFSLYSFLPTKVGVITTFTIVAVLLLLIIKNKSYNYNNLKEDKLKIAVSVIMVSLFINQFYGIWLPSSKVKMIAELINISTESLVIIAIIALSICSVPFVYSLISLFSDSNLKVINEVNLNVCNNKRIYLFCLVIATVVITFCSKSSPIYPFNDWVDSNCFFTVGKSMMNGIVPYRDLFEQKGPYVYLLHGIAWLVDGDGFFGVYILEIVCASIFLYYSYKISSLFFEQFVSVIAIPGVALFTYTSSAFCHGDSVEEICLPIMAYVLYIGAQFYKNRQTMTFIKYIIIGMLSGIVFWSKFTLVGIFVGWFIPQIYYYIKNKQIITFMKSLACILCGVLIVTAPLIIYFGINNGITDLIKVYIVDNIFTYTGDKSDFSIYNNLLNGISQWMVHNFAAFVFTVVGVASLVKKENRNAMVCYTLCVIATFMFVYIGGVFHKYYSLIFSTFTTFGLTALLNLVIKDLRKFDDKKIKNISIIIITLLCLCGSFVITENNYLAGVKKEELPQYKFSKIIKGKTDATLLNYGFLDGGFYTVSEILPTCKAFCKLNNPIKEMSELQKEFVDNGECDFVVTCNEELFSENYELVEQDSFFFEGAERTYYLYQLK